MFAGNCGASSTCKHHSCSQCRPSPSWSRRHCMVRTILLCSNRTNTRECSENSCANPSRLSKNLESTWAVRATDTGSKKVTGNCYTWSPPSEYPFWKGLKCASLTGDHQNAHVVDLLWHTKHREICFQSSASNRVSRGRVSLRNHQPMICSILLRFQ